MNTTIYDREGNELRKATEEEIQHYIDEYLHMPSSWRISGLVSGEPYGYDGSVYMSGGRVELINELPNVDIDHMKALWDRWVNQSAEEFMLYSDTDDIEQAVSEYLDALYDDAIKAQEEWEGPNDLDDMLVAYIQYERIMTQLERE